MKYKNLVIYIIVFILIFVLAVYGYDYLTKTYESEQKALENTETTIPKEKESAPDFTVYDEAGYEVSLSLAKGKPVVVNFWATWCGPCKTELPYFDNLYAEKKEEIEVFMVNLTDGQRETKAAVQKFLAETGYKFPVYYDTDFSAAAAYDIYSIPLTVFVDKDGKISDAHTGAMSEQTLNAYVEKLLGE